MRDRSDNLICVSCQLTPKEKMDIVCQDTDRKPSVDAVSHATHIDGLKFDGVTQILQSKLMWSVDKLNSSQDVRQCLDLSSLIHSLLENIDKIQSLSK